MINPVLATGQIEGGVAQAIGWALYEQRCLARGPDGQRADDQLHHAHVDGPSADPRVLRGAAVRSTAHCGAKGIGELPMDGPAPAIFQRRRARDRRRIGQASAAAPSRSWSSIDRGCMRGVRGAVSG